MAVAQLAAAYLPLDRRLALLDGVDLPEWSQGAALLADLQGFTALGEALAPEPRRAFMENVRVTSSQR